MNEIENYFYKLRFDKNHHLGLGDIRLTVAQQDELVALFKQKLQQHGVVQAEASDSAVGAAVGQRSVGTNAAGGIVDKALSEISNEEFVKAAERYFGGGARKSSEGHL